jgi:hypothetical protein
VGHGLTAEAVITEREDREDYEAFEAAVASCCEAELFALVGKPERQNSPIRNDQNRREFLTPISTLTIVADDSFISGRKSVWPNF